MIRRIRHNSTKPLSAIQSPSQYLTYCKTNNINLNSTVFKGTLYEYHTKVILEKFLHFKNITRHGGAYDNGLDLYGKWNLNYFYQTHLKHYSPKQKISAKSLLNRAVEAMNHELDSPEQSSTSQTLLDSESSSSSQVPGLKSSSGKRTKKLISLENDINALVQCKHVANQISAQTIRELSGIYNFHVPDQNFKNSILKNFIFLVSTGPLTPQATVQLNLTKIPMVFVTVKLLRFPVEEDEVYDFRKWRGGELTGVYYNKVVGDLVDGFDMKLVLNMILKGCSK